MRNATKRMLLGAALLALAGGCSNDDECTTPADCTDTAALAAGEVFACREQVCTAVAQPYAVYGLQDGGRNVYALGTWPDVSAGSTALFDVFAPEDRELDPDAFEIFAGNYLTNDGTRLLSGYTKPGASGQVAVHTLAGGATRYVSVPGNLAAAASGGVFYVSGLTEPSFATGIPAIYALKDGAASVVATAGSVAGNASGPVAIANNDAAVFGFADAAASYQNVLLPLPPGSYAAPATPVDLTAQAKLELGEAFDVATFGDGVAVLRGTQDPNTFERTYSDVVRVALSDTGAAGSPATVLRFVDQCSRVSLDGAIGEDLLLRVTDPDGGSGRIVRLTRSNAAGSTRTPAADCATAQRDPVLGTLQLEAGFSVVDSAALPEGVGAVTAVPVAP